MRIRRAGAHADPAAASDPEDPASTTPPLRRAGVHLSLALVVASALMGLPALSHPAMAFFAVGPLSTDGGVVLDDTSTLQSPTIATTVNNELLLAMMSGNGAQSCTTQATITSTGGLSWTRAARSNTQPGDAEIWWAMVPSPTTGIVVTSATSTSSCTAFGQGLSIVGISGASTTAPIGPSASTSGTGSAPSVSLITTAANALVYGDGNDWSGTTVTPLGRNQVTVDNTVAQSGDTYWSQTLSAPVSVPASTATISDTAGATAVWNMAEVAVDPAGVTAPSQIFHTYAVAQDNELQATTPGITTTKSNDVLVAFVGLDGPKTAGNSVTAVSGAGLTWQRAVQENAQLGDAEIWWARATGTVTDQPVTVTFGTASVGYSVSVIAFSGAVTGTSPIGQTAAASAASGPQSLSLTTTAPNSWFYAVGNDWQQPLVRTVSDGVMVHQSAQGQGATQDIWVQANIPPEALTGTTLTVADSAPTADPWNYAGVEILAAPGTVSTTTVTAAADPSPPGQSVSYTATVTPTSPPVTGTLSFQDDGAAIPGCQNLVVSGDSATCTVAGPATGLHRITANYSGDGDYQPSTSAVWLERIAQGHPAMGWGDNTYGDVGSGTTTSPILTPTLVSGSTRFIQIAAGDDDTIALDASGHVWTWGFNIDGQLGLGTNDAAIHNTPSEVSLPAPIVSIAAGYESNFALTATGQVYAWGQNNDGQLGDGTTTQRDSPVVVPGLSGVAGLGAGNFYGLAILDDGTVRAWGDNTYGELGNGTTTQSPTPVTVSGLSGIVAVAGQQYGALALRSDGTVWAWGDGADGQLGNGSTSGSTVPVQVSGITTATGIAAGSGTGYALLASGAVQSWGFGGYGALGNGGTTSISTPATVLTGVSALGAGTDNAYATLTSGQVDAWGYNPEGEVGDGTIAQQDSPVAVRVLAAPAFVAAGSYNGVALQDLQPTVSLTSSANPSAQGQAVTFRLSVSGTGGAAAGSAAFYDGGTLLATAPLSGGSASYSTSALSNGAHSITADYLGDATYFPATSAVLAQQVGAVPTTTTLSSSANPISPSGDTTYTATIAVTPPGSGTPTGTVSFSDNGTVMPGCASVTVRFGTTASCSVTYSAIGTESIVATYSGDTSFAGSTSAPLTEYISNWYSSPPPATPTTNQWLFGDSCPSASTTCMAVGEQCSTSGACSVAATTPLALELTGGSWTPVAVPLPAGAAAGQLTAVSCPSATVCYAVGGTCSGSCSGGFTQPVIEEWSGGSWQVVAQPQGTSQTDYLFGIACPSTGQCYAVGRNEPCCGHWNTLVVAGIGTTWAFQPSADGPTGGSDTLNGVSCSSTTSCFAVGYYYTGPSGTGYGDTLIDQLSGGSWVQVTSAQLSPTTSEFLQAVSCSSASFCMAVGNTCSSTTCGSGTTAANTAQVWDGSTWTEVAIPSPQSGGINEPLGVSCASDGNCSAVGYASPASGTNGSEILDYSGGAWSLASFTQPNANGNVLEGISCASASTCWAAGWYHTTAGVAQALTVQQAQTEPVSATTLVTGTTSPVVGQPVSLTATVTPTVPMPTGSVAFDAGGAPITGCTAVPLATGSNSATCTYTPGAAGAVAASAAYSGDTNYQPSSGSAGFSVGKASTTTSVSGSPGTITVGQTAQFTATVSVLSPGAGTPGGTVEFLDGGAAIAGCTAVAVSGGTATCSDSQLTGGGHTITATYSGDSNFAGSSTTTAWPETVHRSGSGTNPPTSSANPAGVGQQVTYTVVVGAGGPFPPTGTVDFKDSGTTITGCAAQPLTAIAANPGTAATATCTTSYASAGVHYITVAYPGDGNYVSSSSNPATQETITSNAVSVPAPSLTPGSSSCGEAVVITVTVSGSGPTPTGTVTFSSNGSAISGAIPLSGGSAQLTIASLPVGSDRITATYSGDASYGMTTSPVATEQVTAVVPQVSLSPAPNPAVVGQTVSLAATVAPPAVGMPAAVYGQSGSYTTGGANQGGAVSASGLSGPTYIAVDGSGGVYVDDSSNNRVLYFPAGSTTPTRVYGQGGSFTTNTANLGGVSATSLNDPNGVAVDSAGGLYIADSDNNRVLYFPPGSTTATRVYGQGGSFTSNTANLGGISAASLHGPGDVAVDAAGDLFVSDYDNHRVLMYPPGGTTATRVYGQQGSFSTGAANKGGVSATSLYYPEGLALDSAGDLYVADYGNSRVVMYPAGSATASRIYGQPSANSQTANAGGISASTLAYPSSVLVDHAGGVYIADQGNNRLLYYPAGSTTASEVYGQAGSLTASAANMGGGIGPATLWAPTSMALAADGNLYLSDYSNNRVLLYPAQTVTGTLTVFQGRAVLCSGSVSAGRAGCATSFTNSGTYTLTAGYTATTNVAGATSPAVAETVNPAASTTTLTATPSPATVGQVITFTATVSVTAPGVTSAGGTVAFSTGGTAIGGCAAQAVSGGAATCSIASLAAGRYTVVATYAGDSNLGGSTSAGYVEQVNPGGAASITPVAVAPGNPTVDGQAATLTVSVSAAGPQPTGSVIFSSNGQAISGSIALAGGSASYTTTALPLGTDTLSARYSGDANYAAATSSTSQQTVIKDVTTTSVSGGGSAGYDGPLVITATVATAAPGSIAPTGTVTFEDQAGAISRCSGLALSGGVASCDLSGFAPGTYDILAVYAGDARHSGSTSAAVPATITPLATSTGVTPPATGAVAEQLTIGVTVGAAGATPTGQITVLVDGKPAGVAILAGGRASVLVGPLTAGPHTIAAGYAGATGFDPSQSGAQTLSVGKLTPQVGVTVTPAQSTYGTASVVEVSVTGPTGAPAATGTVTVADNGTHLGTVTLSGGSGSITVAALPAGQDVVTGSYAGDANYLAGSGAAPAAAVSQAPTTVTVMGPGSGVTGQPVPVSVEVASPGGPASGGTVTIYDNGKPIGTAPVVNGRAVLRVQLPAGTNSLTASYGGSLNFAGASTAVSLLLHVLQATPAATPAPAPARAAPPSGGLAGFVSTLTSHPAVVLSLGVVVALVAALIIFLLLARRRRRRDEPPSHLHFG